jgi:hypothetical protein
VPTSSYRKLQLEEPVRAKTFSVCCMVNDWSQYEAMRAAWAGQGYTEELCEFLVCDNAGNQALSAFDAVRAFLREASGRYLLIAHLDVEPLEPAGRLLECIDRVEKADPRWGVIGNAGISVDTGRCEMALEMPGRSFRLPSPFVKVSVIDENLMVLKNGTGITVSADLGGYHFYAFDLCSVATRLGYLI